VIQHQDGHDLAVGQPCLWPALLGSLGTLLQPQRFPARVERLAKIIELAEILHEPVEHECLRISNGADSSRRTQERQGLRLTLNPQLGLTTT
jgi:hypothetical protein